MAKLVTDAEFQEIRDVINDVVETFGQKTINYHLYTGSFSRFNRDKKESSEFDVKALDGLVVWFTEKDQMIESERSGSIDFAEGYVLFGYDLCLTNNLIDANKKILMDPTRDLIEWDGTTYYIEGITPVGQIKDTEAVIKIFFKKRENANS